jgi:hypothetical protein
VASNFALTIDGSFDVVDIGGYTVAIGTVDGSCSNCLVGPSSTTFTLNSSTFSLVISNLVNPQDTIDYSLNVRIFSPHYLFFNKPVPIGPALTPIQFTSQISLSNTIAYRVANITVALQQIAGTEVNITFPNNLFSRLMNCYFGNSRVPNCSATLQADNTYLVRARAINMNANSVSSLIYEVQLYPASLSISS